MSPLTAGPSTDESRKTQKPDAPSVDVLDDYSNKVAWARPDQPLSSITQDEVNQVFDSQNGPAVSTKKVSVAAQERAEILNYFSKDNLKLRNVDWVVATWMLAMHLGCLVAPFFFTWQALAMTIFLHWFTCSFGITMTFHRCLSHRSFKLKTPAKFLGVLAGTISGEGTPLTWASTHRVHHGHSDQHGDPHSPLEGPWWAHLWWMMVKTSDRKKQLLYQYYAPDLVRDPMLRFFDRTFALWLWGSGLVLLAIGCIPPIITNGWPTTGAEAWTVFVTGGLPMILWAMCVRLVLAYHSTWFVNSATHLWGYRNYEVQDASRNLWWVALFAYGEGWHNNHHAHPRLARAGHKWWEVDMTWWTISFLRLIGQATDVDDRIPNKTPEKPSRQLQPNTHHTTA